MDKYVRQLIADIYSAQNWEDPEFDSVSGATSFFSEEQELFEQPFSKTSGLDIIQFPPADRLTDEQMEGICEAIDRLLFSWNIFTDLPEILPSKNAYELMVSVFEENISIVKTGQTSVEFCESIPKTCPFGEYCECRKIDEVIEQREKMLGQEVLKLIAKIRKAPQNLPHPDVFDLIYPQRSESEKRAVPIKSISEWLGFTNDFFPNPSDLTEQQMEAISNALLQFMNENIRQWVANAGPKLRYISLIGYLSLRAKYNGKGGFVLFSDTSNQFREEGRSFDDFNRTGEQ